MGTSKRTSLDAIKGIMSSVSLTSFGFQEDESNTVKFSVDFCGRRHVVCGICILNNGLLEVELHPRNYSGSDGVFRILAAELPAESIETIYCVMAELFGC